MTERKDLASSFGLHRVRDQVPCLPQAATRLDNSLPIYNNEIVIEVERLNIDAASFVQMEEEAGGDVDRIAAIVLSNTTSNGKQQNRVTGSGGMLVGKISEIGSKYKGPLKAKKGDKVATLVSLTLTPLHLDHIIRVNKANHQIEVKGHAILFETSIAAIMPEDIAEPVAMAGYDVCGAPAWTYALAKSGMTVVILGAGGKAGLLSCAAARDKMKRSGKIIAIEPMERALSDIEKLGVCNEVLQIDATNPVAVLEGIKKATKGKMADLVISVASVPNTENSALLSVNKKGKVVFFSMATSFAKVALGAEGIATSSQLLFGNGYYPNHAVYTLDLLRKNKKLRAIFDARYGS